MAAVWEWARNILAIVGAAWLGLLAYGTVVDHLRSGGWWWDFLRGED